MNSNLWKYLENNGLGIILKKEKIQNLWSDYGELSRIHLKGGEYSSVILKHIRIPEEVSHPRGFNTSLSNQRKIKSYQVETYWYETYNDRVLSDENSIIPKTLGTFQEAGESFLVLQDLDSIGYSKILTDLSWDEIEVVLSWLASFHAKFLNAEPEGLWESGTYWHLETRPDEWARLEESPLKSTAGLIDSRLRASRFQTLVHGDAKLANFCFSEDQKKVAAVDFQYVGRGVGVKDVAYFIGSCLSEEESREKESDILNFYFKQLKNYSKYPYLNELESEWRELYHFAWADFHRFLKGWSPGHWKLNDYSEDVTEKVLKKMSTEIQAGMKEAAIKAGELILSYWQGDFQISQKDLDSLASSVVTEVDHKAEKLILDLLNPLVKKYDLGILAEEKGDDGSRHEKAAFFAIDPLDGTLQFSQGKEGFAVSIGLVSKQGESLIGVVYDPVGRDLYSATKGRGAYINGLRFEADIDESAPLTMITDPSFRDKEDYQLLKDKFSFEFKGGTVLNSLHVLKNQNGLYYKKPRPKRGGGAIWDYAAVACVARELGFLFGTYQGEQLKLNQESLYFHQEGFFTAASIHRFDQIKSLVE